MHFNNRSDFLTANKDSSVQTLVDTTFFATLDSKKSSFGDTWVELFAPHHEYFFEADLTETRDLLRNALSNSKLDDWGGGQRYLDSGYQLAIAVNAAEYTNVDRHLDHNLILERPFLPRLTVISKDMLLYATSLDPSRRNIMLNGIDLNVIRKPAYHYRLAEEITRVVLPGSLAFGVYSEVFAYFSEKNWRDLTPSDAPRNYDMSIFERK